MSKVTLFSSVSDVSNPEYIDLIEYLESIRDGKWATIVSQCREILDKKERNEFKRKFMPTVCMSGEFSYRNDESLIEHNSFICIEFDGVSDVNALKRKLCNDKYIMAIWISPSGDGLRSLWKVKETKHRDSFLGICKYLMDKYDEVCETDGIEVSKPYIVSDDAGMFINYSGCEIFKDTIKERVIKPVQGGVFHTSSDFEMVYNQITGRHLDITPDYSTWRKLGFALAEQFGEGGRDYFHNLSQFNKSYKHKTCDKQFSACLRAQGSKQANISSFYYLAKEAGISIVSEQTKKIVRTTKNGKVAGLSKETIKKNLAEFDNITGADNLIDSVFESDVKEERDQASQIHQLELYISHNYSLRMNEVTGYLENNGRVLTPSDLNSLFISAKKLISALDYNLMIRLLKSDFTPVYNPFYEYLGSDGMAVILPPIGEPDQNSRYESPLLDLLSSCIINDDPKYTKYFVRKWYVGIISAMHKVHSPLLLALLGRQHSGKTEYFRRLLPSQLFAYYGESKLDKEKDDELLMCEKILIVDDELGGKSHQDSKKLKDITSKQHFSLRRPYGDHNETILRLAVLGGTSNTLKVFYDETGNRRVIPIVVKDVDKVLYNSIDKGELMREAFRLYKDGFDWRVTPSDTEYLNKDKDRYENPSKETELLEQYYEPCITSEATWMSTTEIIVEVKHLTGVTMFDRVVFNFLDGNGYIRKPISSAKNTRKWGVKKIGRDGLVKDSDLPF